MQNGNCKSWWRFGTYNVYNRARCVASRAYLDFKRHNIDLSLHIWDLLLWKRFIYPTNPNRSFKCAHLRLCEWLCRHWDGRLQPRSDHLADQIDKGKYILYSCPKWPDRPTWNLQRWDHLRRSLYDCITNCSSFWWLKAQLLSIWGSGILLYRHDERCGLWRIQVRVNLYRWPSPARSWSSKLWL